jgi:hypothetical protein
VPTPHDDRNDYNQRFTPTFTQVGPGVQRHSFLHYPQHLINVMMERGRQQLNTTTTYNLYLYAVAGAVPNTATITVSITPKTTPYVTQFGPVCSVRIYITDHFLNKELMERGSPAINRLD